MYGIWLWHLYTNVNFLYSVYRMVRRERKEDQVINNLQSKFVKYLTICKHFQSRSRKVPEKFSTTIWELHLIFQIFFSKQLTKIYEGKTKSKKEEWGFIVFSHYFLIKCQTSFSSSSHLFTKSNNHCLTFFWTNLLVVFNKPM